MLYPKSTFGTLRNLVQINTGRDDTQMLPVVDAALNWSILLAAIVFKPQELSTTETVATVPDQIYINLPSSGTSGIMNLYGAIIHISNEYKPLFIIDYERMMYITNIWPQTAGLPKYIAPKGNMAYFDCKPSNAWDVTLSYHSYPKPLSDANDTVPFGGYDSFIVSAASALVFSAIEETESANAWTNVGGQLMQLFRLNAQEAAILNNALSTTFPMFGSNEK